MDRLTWPAALVSPKTVIVGAAVGVFLGVTTEQWGVIAVSLLIGLVMRWTHLASTNQPVTRRIIKLDLGALAFNGLIALNLAESGHLTSLRLGFATALIASSSLLAFSRAYERWFGIKPGEPTKIFTAPGTHVEIPASAPTVDVIAVGKATPKKPVDLMMQAMTDAGFAPDDPRISELMRKLEDLG